MERSEFQLVLEPPIKWLAFRILHFSITLTLVPE